MWLYVHRTFVTFRSISFLIEEKEAKDGESRFFDGSMELRELSDVYQKPNSQLLHRIQEKSPLDLFIPTTHICFLDSWVSSFMIAIKKHVSGDCIIPEVIKVSRLLI